MGTLHALDSGKQTVLIVDSSTDMGFHSEFGSKAN